jgi:hypothetical protein
MLLAAYPETKPALLAAAKRGADRSEAFNQQFRNSLRRQWPIVQARWRMLCATMDYGFDWDRERIDLSTKDPLWDGRTIKLRVSAERGWQSSGVRFARDTRVSIDASGRCVLDENPKPWISEPPGVTVQYAGGRPLGQLLVAILPNQAQESANGEARLAPLRVVPVGRSVELALDDYCWLLFRINDKLGDYGNNRDGYSVEITAQTNASRRPRE